MIEIAVINESTVVSDHEVDQFAAAAEEQALRDFTPIWGCPPLRLVFCPKGEAIPTGVWQLVAFDNSDQAGALGYHDVTADGYPIGKFFPGTCQQYNTSWTVDGTHELLEMLGDPQCSTVVNVTANNGQVWQAAFEACDACEDDSMGYEIDGVLVTDFVYPSWFDNRPNPSGVTGLDFKGHLSTSLADAFKQGNPVASLGVGGYIGLLPPGGQWQQLVHPDSAQNFEVVSQREGSRRARRLRGYDSWVTSPPPRQG